jgi:hypothetical protein
MSARIYSSFEQINAQLEILEVERQLCHYRMRALISGTRTPTLAAQLAVAAIPVVKTFLIPWLIRRLRQRFIRE